MQRWRGPTISYILLLLLGGEGGCTFSSLALSCGGYYIVLESGWNINITYSVCLFHDGSAMGLRWYLACVGL